MPDVLETWHRVVRDRDLDLLASIVADEAVLHSPVVHTPQRGKPITLKYLAAALNVLNNASFRYVATWNAENSAVLEFMTEIDGIQIDGADFITWNEAGQIVDFKVMIRPLKAINIVMQRMGEELARAG